MTRHADTAAVSVRARTPRRALHRRWDLIGAVGLGGVVGTLVRYEVATALPTAPGRFPWATFAVNVLGAAILGFAAALVFQGWAPTRFTLPLIGIGFCGGLTTFSTWTVDAVQLARDHHTGAAVLYLVATLLAGLVALFSGVVGARALAREGGPR
jgi:CrcB protein